MTRGNATYWHVFEGIGTVRQLVNAQSQVVDAYAFDAWGNELTRPQSLIPNPFRYVGKHGYYLDTESALMLLGVRYYGAANGLFLSRDLIEGYGYTYAADNPVRWIDPEGLQQTDSQHCNIVNGQRECAPSGLGGGGDGVSVSRSSYIPGTIDVVIRCKDCPNLIRAIRRALDLITNNRTCGNQFRECCPQKPPVVQITCPPLSTDVWGRTPKCDTVEINKYHPGCRSSNIDILAQTLVHELVHACWWCAGKPYNPNDSFTCICGRYWERCDPKWEICAEKAAHACFPNLGDLPHYIQPSPFQFFYFPRPCRCPIGKDHPPRR